MPLPFSIPFFRSSASAGSRWLLRDFWNVFAGVVTT